MSKVLSASHLPACMHARSWVRSKQDQTYFLRENLIFFFIQLIGSDHKPTLEFFIFRSTALLPFSESRGGPRYTIEPRPLLFLSKGAWFFAITCVVRDTQRVGYSESVFSESENIFHISLLLPSVVVPVGIEYCIRPESKS